MPDASHDVFISYSSRDKPIADGICAVLEQRGIRCWIAPRDVLPGADWGQSIVRGINGARIFVLVFSNFANTSAQVRREVERAAHRELPIIPFRVEDVQPNDSLEFFISTPHWLDAFTPPMERHVERLAHTIKKLAALLPSNPPLNTPAEVSDSTPAQVITPSPPAPPVDAQKEISPPAPVAPDDAAARASTSSIGREKPDTLERAPPLPKAAPSIESLPPSAEASAGEKTPLHSQLSARTLWIGSLIALLAIGAAILTGRPLFLSRQDTNAADIERSWADCRIDGPADAVLRACTTLIESGKISPDDLAKALTARGVANYNKHDLEAALQDESAAIRVQPGHVRAYVDRGNIYRQKGDIDQAIQDYNTAIRLGPVANAYNNRGLIFMAKKDYPAALRDFSSAIARDSKLAVGYLNRALAYSAMGNCRRAMNDYDRAIQMSPKNGAAWLMRGNCWQLLKNYDAAIRDYDTVIRLNPDMALAYFGRAMSYTAVKKYDPAIRDYGTAAHLNRNDPNIYYNRGNLYYAKGDYDAAINDYSAAIHLNAGIAGAYFTRGNAYYAKHDYRSAIADYSAAVHLKPDYARAYYYRAMAERAGKNMSAAKADEARSKRLGYVP